MKLLFLPIFIVILSLVITVYCYKSITLVFMSTNLTFSVQGLILCSPGCKVDLYLPRFSINPANDVLTYKKGSGQQKHMQGHHALKNPKKFPPQIKHSS